VSETDVSAFEAKTHLADLLRKAEQGQSFVIHRRGKPVARLVPIQVEQQPALADLLPAFRDFRRKVGKAMDVRELIAEGRRR
jgi:prevent-host-death family protein